MSDRELPTTEAEAGISQHNLPPGRMPDRIGLCFSGGGLRATFFHLGVVRALRAQGLLSRVTQVYSVSGGSILGAHLVLNWDKYNGSDEDYERMEQELRAFGDRDLRGRVVRRWLLGCTVPFLRLLGKFRRIDLLEREYGRFFQGKCLSDLGRSTTPRQPEIHILATSFTTGNLCSFSRKGFWMDDGKQEPRLIPSTIIPLSLAVAASSAFPPLFPPVPITRKMLGASERDMPLEPDYLSDGGVFDNLGFEKFARMKFGDEDQPNWLFLSDAGASFDWDVKRQFSWIVSRTVRATDILMKRLDERVLATATTGRLHTIHLPISQVLENDKSGILPVDLQKRVAKIRTDLDVFSPLEIDLLIRFGYEVCTEAMAARLPASAAAKPVSWRAYDGESTKAEVGRLHQADVRSMGIFNRRDWASYALLGWLLILVGIWPALLGIRSAMVAQQVAQADQQSAEAAALTNTLQTAIRETAGANPKPPDPPPDPTTQVQRSNYLIFVQFAGVITREQIKSMSAQLFGLGWRVFADLNRTSAAAGMNEVRYSANNDERAATLLAEEIGKAIQTTRAVRIVQDSRVAANTLQAWISR